jgi:hypothetical protein
VRGELLAGEPKRGALEGDLAAELGAAHAASAPAQLFELLLGVAEALFGSCAGFVELAPACREQAGGGAISVGDRQRPAAGSANALAVRSGTRSGCRSVASESGSCGGQAR